MSCLFCGKPVLGGGSAHWMWGGYLPADEAARLTAAAAHAIRLLGREPGVSHRGPWTAEKVRPRPELVPRIPDKPPPSANIGFGLALADPATPANSVIAKCLSLRSRLSA